MFTDRRRRGRGLACLLTEDDDDDDEASWVHLQKTTRRHCLFTDRRRRGRGIACSLTEDDEDEGSLVNRVNTMTARYCLFTQVTRRCQGVVCSINKMMTTGCCLFTPCSYDNQGNVSLYCIPNMLYVHYMFTVILNGWTLGCMFTVWYDTAMHVFYVVMVEVLLPKKPPCSPVGSC